MFDINKLEVGTILKGLSSGNKYKVTSVNKENEWRHIQTITISNEYNSSFVNIGEKNNFSPYASLEIIETPKKEKLTFKSFFEAQNVD